MQVNHSAQPQRIARFTTVKRQTNIVGATLGSPSQPRAGLQIARH